MRLMFMAVAAASTIAFPALSHAGVHGSSCEASADQFAKVAIGMSYAQVKEIIGCDGVVMSESEMAGFKSIMVGWDGEGGAGANMNAVFQNGKLHMKSQFGLR